jgi:hypothetical protein
MVELSVWQRRFVVGGEVCATQDKAGLAEVCNNVCGPLLPVSDSVYYGSGRGEQHTVEAQVLSRSQVTLELSTSMRIRYVKKFTHTYLKSRSDCRGARLVSLSAGP